MGPAYAESGPWSTKQFLDNLAAGKIERVVIAADGQRLFATDTEGDQHPTLILPGQGASIIKELEKKDVPFNVQIPNDNQNAIGNLLSAVGPPLLFIGALFLLSRGAGGQ